jgi:hypothetical protein
MPAAEQDANENSLQAPTSTHEPNVEEWLTDVIDAWKRDAFRRSLERRHAAVSYRAVVVESTRLIRTSSS